jgi:succinate dehydrogenase / fumarate reductase flavoprotein subunit
MSRYAPEKMELGPRDMVSRAIETEVREGRGGPDGEVFLDLVHLGKERILERLPQIRELCCGFEGVDPLEEPIPIKPTAHYSMGGISTDINGLTPIEGVYAAGESGCVSVHGANRLGGNSLLDILVFGRRAGNHATEYARQTDIQPMLQNPLAPAETCIKALMDGESSETIADIRRDLGNLMAKKAGIYRNAADLTEGQAGLAELKARYKRLKITDKSQAFNTELTTALELGNLLDLAEIVVEGALVRQESRGSHYREDFPQRNDKDWLVHTVATRGSDERPVLHFEPVKITQFQPEARTY